MFANRFTALVDACSLAGVLHRNLILSLAEAEFFRLRWSQQILDETENAIAAMLAEKGHGDAIERARKARAAMERAFEDATVVDFDSFFGAVGKIPDEGDRHVIAAALKTRAAVIVTENTKDFPDEVLRPLNLERRTGDQFIADTIALDPGKAVAAIRRMRVRLKNPAKTPETLLLDMEAVGLVETVDVLKSHILSL